MSAPETLLVLLLVVGVTGGVGLIVWLTTRSNRTEEIYIPPLNQEVAASQMVSVPAVLEEPDTTTLYSDIPDDLYSATPYDEIRFQRRLNRSRERLNEQYRREQEMLQKVKQEPVRAVKIEQHRQFDFET